MFHLYLPSPRIFRIERRTTYMTPATALPKIMGAEMNPAVYATLDEAGKSFAAHTASRQPPYRTTPTANPRSSSGHDSNILRTIHTSVVALYCTSFIMR